MKFNPFIKSSVVVMTACAATMLMGQEASSFRIENQVIITSPKDVYLTQSRAGVIPGEPPRIVLTTQETERVGSHGYRDMFAMHSMDNGRAWSPLKRVPQLTRERHGDGYEVVIGDVTPQWHAKTQMLLATGKTFNFKNGTRENILREQVSYAVHHPASGEWSGLKIMQMPVKDHEGKPFVAPNAGCHQRWDLPDGGVLLPIRYQKDAKKHNYTTIVARCSFDGDTLTYREHGSELSLPKGRGLYEPSVTAFNGRYYLTLRADHSAFVTRGEDGIHYEPIKEWAFDDGEVLGSYNTQQHWVTHHQALYLTYTRRGANNDHIFRHRAPLFIARVDTEKLCVLRDTEQVLIPEEGADLGNFGVTQVSPEETWVVTSEFPGKKSANNRVLVARLLWDTPNEVAP